MGRQLGPLFIIAQRSRLPLEHRYCCASGKERVLEALALAGKCSARRRRFATSQVMGQNSHVIGSSCKGIRKYILPCSQMGFRPTMTPLCPGSSRVRISFPALSTASVGSRGWDTPSHLSPRGLVHLVILQCLLVWGCLLLPIQSPVWGHVFCVLCLLSVWPQRMFLGQEC